MMQDTVKLCQICGKPVEPYESLADRWCHLRCWSKRRRVEKSAPSSLPLGRSMAERDNTEEAIDSDGY